MAKPLDTADSDMNGLVLYDELPAGHRENEMDESSFNPSTMISCMIITEGKMMA